jgi:peptidoglycan hydrolase-like protein with peptidoglycan-binding domain
LRKTLFIPALSLAVVFVFAQTPVEQKTIPSKSSAKTTAKKNSTLKKTSSKATGSKTSSSKKTSSKKTTTKKAAAPTWRSTQRTPTPERYREIQQALASKGYLQSGAPSGVWDSSSVEALKKFQEDQSLEPSGKLDSLSLIALGLGPKRDAPPAPQP